MITLFESDIKDEGRQSSKGNQLKWYSKDCWYKADSSGYEGLAEYICAELLSRTSLKKDEYVAYETIDIAYRSRVFHGCRSRNFVPAGWQLITLERLFYERFAKSLYQSVWSIQGVEERIRFLVAQVERLTGLRDFGIYFSKMMAVDAFFLNEDRHMHNIALLKSPEGQFRLSPFFDNGSALLSDTMMDYPMEEDIFRLIPTARAKTVSADFDEQLDAAEYLYGRNFRIFFDMHDAEKLLERDTVYPQEVKERVLLILREQYRRYPYLQAD